MKPTWIRTKWPDMKAFKRIDTLLSQYNINTVCKSARCPNIGTCFSRNHLTFMILGDICTRGCRFCSVKKGLPLPPDPHEIENIVKVVGILGLSHVIITSVTRDDLPDSGAGVFGDLISRLKEKYINIKIEILTPDFNGEAPNNIINAGPNIWAHNIETVPRLYNKIRPNSDYRRSIKLLASIKRKKNDIFTKSGIMLGLGEKEKEVLKVFSDLREIGVDIVTIGQYLKPSIDSIEVKRFLEPNEFYWYKKKVKEMGFMAVLSEPLVRSSYKEVEL